MIWISMLIILGCCTVMDALRRRVWMPFVFGSALYIIICLFFLKQPLWENLIGGAVICAFFEGLHIFTGGQIGTADGVLLGLMILASGLWIGSAAVLLCFGYAFVGALILVCFFRKNRQTRMPLVPFMLLGYVTVIIIQKWGIG